MIVMMDYEIICVDHLYPKRSAAISPNFVIYANHSAFRRYIHG